MSNFIDIATRINIETGRAIKIKDLTSLYPQPVRPKEIYNFS